MKNALNSVKISKPSTNEFDLTHDVKMSMRMGKLVPVLAMECLPGDRVLLSCENLIRLAPMLAPMMHRVDTRIEYFFVPNRLVWENWEKWITNGGDQPIDDPDYGLPVHPYLDYTQLDAAGKIAYNELFDYLGLPDPGQCPEPNTSERISAIPFAAYQKIYDEYYRDQNLISSEQTAYTLTDGNNSDNVGIGTLRTRAWEADYFTKALPFAQKGESVDLPLGVVELDPATTGVNGLIKFADTHGNAGTGALSSNTGDFFREGIGGDQVVYDPNGTLVVGATTINDLRLAMRLQEWLEKNARGGTRYSELIRSHFNVMPEDARLQRPEYIVGVKNPIQISEVLNMTGTAEAPQGNMAGHGINLTKGNYGKYFCREHGYIIGIMSVMPTTAYQQGIPKHFLKYSDPSEIAWPTFAHLGEQEIQKREIMAFQDTIGDDTFGYTPRYMEYKTLPSRVAGEFKSTLNFWHMGRIFSAVSPPLLNQSFVEADPTTRIFAVTAEEDHIYAQVLNIIKVRRALPFYGTPSF